MITLASMLRYMSVEIPEEWKKWKTKQVPVQELGQAQRLRDKVVDTEIKKPSLFLRDLGRVIDYIGTMEDPKKHGIIQDLSKFNNDFRPKKDTHKYPVLTKNFQQDMIDSAANLDNNARLIEMLRKLFMEEYETGTPVRKKKACIAKVLRDIAAAILAPMQRRIIEDTWMHKKNPDDFIKKIRPRAMQWLDDQQNIEVTLSRAINDITRRQVTLDDILKPPAGFVPPGSNHNP